MSHCHDQLLLNANLLLPGIGENGDLIRSLACSDLGWAGVALDEGANRATVREVAGEIQAPGSRVKVGGCVGGSCLSKTISMSAAPELPHGGLSAFSSAGSAWQGGGVRACVERSSHCFSTGSFSSSWACLASAIHHSWAGPHGP